MERNTICPRTGMECLGKKYLADMFDRLVESQISLDLARVVPEDSEARDEVLAELDARRAVVRVDLKAPCSGDPCGPLARTASRVIFGGPSHGEVLRESR